MDILKIPQNSFPFIRFLCALIVLYEHAVVLTGEKNLPCFDLRGIVVNIFFILSGFWVTQSYLKSSSIREYAKKRFKKIFPLYFAVVIFSAIFLAFISSLSVKEYFINIDFFKYLIANLSTLNFMHPTLPGVFEGMALGGSVNGSLWTIKVELGFYIILPIIIYLIEKLTLKKIIGRGYGCVVLLSLYLLSVAYQIFMPMITEKTKLPSSLNNQLPAFVLYFVSGMFFFLNFEKLFSKLNILVIPSSIIFVLCFIFKFPVISNIVEPITLCIIIMWLAFNLKPFFIISPKYDYSYTMYLVHYPLIMTFTYLKFYKIWNIGFFLTLSSAIILSVLLEKSQKKIIN